MGAHSRSTIVDVLLKESWVAGSFFGLETVTVVTGAAPELPESKRVAETDTMM